jgi:S-DNA-T family DNA segregation ATPase FtsK/SpoIIIE
MIERILKIELVSLLFLTLITVVYHLYGDQFPDNFLSISSFAGEINFISYYIFSMFSIIGLAIGPWLMVPFITYALVYHFKYSRRDYKLDLFGLVFLILFTGALFSMLSSQYLGTGVQKLIENSLTPMMTMWLMILSFFLFIGTTFRKMTIQLYQRIADEVMSFSFEEFSEGIKIRVARFNDNMEARRKESNFKKSAEKVNKTVAAKGKTKERLKKLLPSKESVKMPKVIKDVARDISKTQAKVFLGDEEKKQELEAVAEKPNVAEIAKEKVEAIKTKDNKDNQPETNEEKDAKVATVRAPSIGKSDYQKVVNGLSYKEADSNAKPLDPGYFTDIKDRIEDKLREFNINAQIIDVMKGPVVDTFELELGEGVQLSKVLNREKDISLALLGASIRIVYPLKGKSTIGIEVPRNPREFIFLGEIFQSEVFDKTKAKLPIAMGKDAFGEPMVVDLATMPHMLVAGATGAGKSVFINALLVSLLVKLSPEELNLILIDPKQLELALYQNLPHLSLPVITESGMAMNALLWCVQEMERRYSILKDLGVRNIATYNEKVAGGGEKIKEKIGKYFNFHEEENFKLPYIVVVIDEFADLILTKNGKDIETNVSRLAAKARAAGIHLVVATQRPSVDVITGTIKSNFPTRVSFKVTTGKDSSTILDSYGAEKLLGKGDMLFKQGVENIRAHSSFIEEDEIEVITESLSMAENVFDPEALDFLENGPDSIPVGEAAQMGGGSSERDAKFDEAIEIIMESKLASASMLQRRLKIGYNRAANLIESLEEAGYVGPPNGSKGREVLARK